jgi:hypothetical protein
MAVVPAELRGPIPSTPDRLPFRSCRNPRSRHYLDLDAVGYVEEEWFAHGHADAHDADDQLVATAAPFTTRLLIRRPARVDDVSGTVHLEPLHNIGETSATWNVAADWIVRAGHTWIGITTSAGTYAEAGSAMSGGLSHLKLVDPERYAALDYAAFAVPAPRSGVRNPNADMAVVRHGLAMSTAHGVGAMAAIVAALRDADAPGPLQGLPVERRIASGWSQTGNFWSSFLERGFDAALAAAPGERPALDGYLIAVAPPPQRSPASQAILVNLLSESEVVGTLVAPMEVPDDSDEPRVRGYEVPGSFHLWHLGYGGHFQVADHGTTRHNDRSWARLVPALLDGVDRWSRGGAALPREPRITRNPDADDGVARDEHGNATGGVRTAWVDAPSARYLPRCECSPVIGEMRPFDVVDSEHATAWHDAVRDMEARGWLLADDAAALAAHPE